MVCSSWFQIIFTSTKLLMCVCSVHHMDLSGNKLYLVHRMVPLGYSHSQKECKCYFPCPMRGLFILIWHHWVCSTLSFPWRATQKLKWIFPFPCMRLQTLSHLQQHYTNALLWKSTIREKATNTQRASAPTSYSNGSETWLQDSMSYGTWSTHCLKIVISVLFSSQIWPYSKLYLMFIHLLYLFHLNQFLRAFTRLFLGQAVCSKYQVVSML